jgi:hypothetical protein
MKKIILSVAFVAAMGLFVNVNAQDTKKADKKEGTKTEQCCKKEAKAGEKKSCEKKSEGCCKSEAKKKEKK